MVDSQSADINDEALNRGIAALSVEPFFEAMIAWGKEQEMPGTPPGTFPDRMREFEELYRRGVVQVNHLTDEEAEEVGVLALTRKTVEEKERTYIFIGVHPYVTARFVSGFSGEENNTLIRGFVEMVLEALKLYRELKAAGAKFDW